MKYRAFTRITDPIREFARLESASGLVLLACTGIAMFSANSFLNQSYFGALQREITIGLGPISLSKNVLHWVNDGLMPLFFFVVGLEIKREILHGELSSPKQAALPIACAIGGMLVPALIYLVINGGSAASRGWGIPMATDIAFSIGVLTLFGKRIPWSAKIFLTAVAIIDDLGAVIVIALFYTEQISIALLALGLGIWLLLWLLNIFHIRRVLPYALLGIGVWLAFLKSGIHPTIAGVFVAMTIPAGTRDSVAEQRKSMLNAMELYLHPWISFGIVPVFALANAGVALTSIGTDWTSTAAILGVVLGLVLGKQIGITGAAALSIYFGIAKRPTSVSWKLLYSISWLGGIGFTMSLFISALAFGGVPLNDAAKLGILIASVIAGIGGFYMLKRNLPRSVEMRLPKEDF